MSSPTTSITQQLANLNVNYIHPVHRSTPNSRSSKIYEEQWLEVPYLKCIVLVRSPRIPSYTSSGSQLRRKTFTDCLSFRTDAFLQGVVYPNVMSRSATRLATLSRASVFSCAFPLLYHPLQAWMYHQTDCESGPTCPYPWHIPELEKIIGPPPRWMIPNGRT
ncbi:hypothetical protein V8B97DRAFT_398424 [Scleroderma yunnanense]